MNNIYATLEKIAITKCMITLLLSSLSFNLKADDIDLYTGQTAVVDSDGGNGAALTFLLDSSGSMSFGITDTSDSSVNYYNAQDFYDDGERRTIMKNAFIDYISAAASDLKAGFYKYRVDNTNNNQSVMTDYLINQAGEQTQINQLVETVVSTPSGGSFYEISEANGSNITTGRFRCDWRANAGTTSFCALNSNRANYRYDAGITDIIPVASGSDRSYAGYIHFDLPTNPEYFGNEIVDIRLNGVSNKSGNMDLTVMVYETLDQGGAGSREVFDYRNPLASFNVNLNDSSYVFSQDAIDEFEQLTANGVQNLTLAIRSRYIPSVALYPSDSFSIIDSNLSLQIEYTDSATSPPSLDGHVINSLESIGSDLLQDGSGVVYDLNIDDPTPLSGQDMRVLELNDDSLIGLRFLLLPFDAANYQSIDSISLVLTSTNDLPPGQSVSFSVSLVSDSDVMPVESNSLSTLLSSAVVSEIVTIDDPDWNDDGQSTEISLPESIVDAIKFRFSEASWSYQDAITLILEKSASPHDISFKSYEESHSPGSCSLGSTGITYNLKMIDGDMDFCNTGEMAKLKFEISNASSEFMSMYKSQREEIIDKAKQHDAYSYGKGTPLAYTYIQIADYYNNNIQSPLVDTGSKECGIPDAIVMLTDGEEVSTVDPSFSFESYFDNTGADFTCAGIGQTYWSCSNNLAVGLVNQGIDVNTGEGSQNYKINSYGILFGPDNSSAFNSLTNFAIAAGTANDDDEAYSAQTGYELVEVFKKIESSVVFQSASAFTPNVSPGSASSFESSDELYYPLFTPENSLEWPGNMKRYSFWDISASTDSSDFQVVDTARSPVYNESVAGTDTFTIISDDAWSWWSDAKDGADVSAGGASQETAAASRNIYTYIPNSNYANVNLSNNVIDDNIESEFWVHSSTITVTNADKQALILKGKQSWGPVIHNLPVLVNQKRLFETRTVTHGGDDRGFIAGSINTVYVGDNLGFMHAIDAGEETSSEELATAETQNKDNTGGNELWSFMPIELLPNLHRVVNDNTNAGTYNPEYRTRFIYGVDGESTVYRKDYNRDGDYLDADDNLNLYFGLRRGGSAYYGLDIADSFDSYEYFGSGTPEAAGSQEPKLLFRLYNTYTTTVDYENSVNIKLHRLAETWSPITVTKVLWDGALKEVLIFGGGYDSLANEEPIDSDFRDSVSTPQLGNAVYIVDAITGELLGFTSSVIGSASEGVSHSDMEYSIPGRIAVVDIDGGGADLLYATDVGGNVFRIELDKLAGDNDGGGDTTTENIIKDVITFASVGRDAATDLSNKRVFFSGPSVTRISNGPMKNDLAIVLTSGFIPDLRNDDIQDVIAVMFDDDLFLEGTNTTTAISAQSAPLSIANFIDTTNEEFTSDVLNKINNENDKFGWYILLNESNAEKVTGEPKVIKERIFLTTFSIDNPDVDDACSVAVGQSNSYAMYLDGTAVYTAGRVINESPGFSTTGSVIKNVKGSLDTYFLFGTESVCLEGTCTAELIKNTNTTYESPTFVTDTESLIRTQWRQCIDSNFGANECGSGL